MPVHVTEGPKLELQSSAWNMLGVIIRLSGLMILCNLYRIGQSLEHFILVRDLFG